MIELNETVWAQLVQRLDRLPHALLLHGPRGTGKLALTERLAQLLLCESRDAGRAEPCGSCDGCRWYLGGQHPDFRRIEPEAIAKAPPPADDDRPVATAKAKPSLEIKIDQVRELAAFLNLGSHRGARRVTLVHPAEAMNASSANALLKGLEEPPPGACFLLVSHQPARLLPTIRSRCVSVAVPLPDRAAALKWLQDQGVRDSAAWLAFAGGAPLRAFDYANGPQAATIERMLGAATGGDTDSIGAIGSREDVELLCEVLQKVASDRALAALSGRSRFSESPAAVSSGSAIGWLSFARKMGRNRALASHPLNPHLFCEEMLREFKSLS